MIIWTSNLFFSIKLVITPNFMGYNAFVRVLDKQSDENMRELGSFFVEYSKILPEFIWESGDLNATQKEFLELSIAYGEKERYSNNVLKRLGRNIATGNANG